MTFKLFVRSPSGAKHPRKSRGGEQSEHVGLSHNFSVKAFAQRNLIQIQEWKRVTVDCADKKFKN